MSTYKIENENSEKLKLFENNENVNVVLLNDLKSEKSFKEKPKKLKISKGKYVNHFLFIIFGIFLITLGVLSILYPLEQLIIAERLRMRPGFPQYNIWIAAEPQVLVKTYIFTVKNAEDFLANPNEKLQIEEIGPIIYQEYTKYTDVIRHPNNASMSYMEKKYLEFKPELNEPDILNRTIIVPNIILLGMSAFINNYFSFIKMGFNQMSKSEPMFINTTIYNYLWNLTTPTFDKVNQFLPFMMPTSNFGVLTFTYTDIADQYNVKIGTKNGYKNFFKLNSLNNSFYSNGVSPKNKDCAEPLFNSTEGAVFPFRLQPDTEIYLFRKTCCRILKIIYSEEVKTGWISAFKYNIDTKNFDRTNLKDDCFKGYEDQIYPDGIYDISKCHSDLPLALSLPHYHGHSHGPWNNYIEGFNASLHKDINYLIIEPITGVALFQSVAMQINYVMPRFKGFRLDVQKFSEMIVPQFWMELRMDKPTLLIEFLVVLNANILPVLQYLISLFLLLGGTVILVLRFVCFHKNTKKNLSGKMKKLLFVSKK